MMMRMRKRKRRRRSEIGSFRKQGGVKCVCKRGRGRQGG